MRPLAWIAVIGLSLSAVFLGLAFAATGGKLDRLTEADFAGEMPLAAGAGMKQWAFSGDHLQIGLPAVVHVIPGAPARLTVRGPQDEVDRVRFGDGELTMVGHEAWFGHSRRLDVTLQGGAVKSYSLSGVGVLKLGHLDQDRLALHISGAGDAGAEGRADELDVSISGAGNAHFGSLVAKVAHVAISGAGNAVIDASDEADISLSGIGNVHLLTRPKKLVTHISGLGQVSGPDGRSVNARDDD